MFFKKIILYTIVNVTALLFVTFFLTGFQISQTYYGYYILIPLVLSFVNYFLDPLIKFFTLKIKFLTIWLFASLIFSPIIYFSKFLLTGLDIKDGVFRSINIVNIQFSSFNTNELAVVITASIFFGFCAALTRWLTE